jgi:hypothetical protein
MRHTPLPFSLDLDLEGCAIFIASHCLYFVLASDRVASKIEQKWLINALFDLPHSEVSGLCAQQPSR